VRAQTDDFAHKLYYAETDFTIADRAVELAGAARRQADAGGAGVAAGEAGVTAPIIGASKLPHLDEALAALDVRLDADGAAVPRGAVLTPHSGARAPSQRQPLMFPPVVRRASAPQLPADLDRALRLVHRLDDAERALLWHVSLLVPPSARAWRSAWSASCRVVPIIVFSMISGVVADAWTGGG
jgi:hypothetical protein